MGDPDKLTADGAETGEPVLRRDELGINSWDVGVLLATVVLAVTIPLDLVFEPDPRWPAVVSAVISLLFVADIRARFTRPITVKGFQITDPTSLRQRYVGGWLTVDLLAAIPFDLIALLPGIEGSFAQTIRLLGLLRLVRIVRIIALQREWRVRTSFNPAVMRLSFFFFWICLFAHWIACGWIAINSTSPPASELGPYQEGLYWTITTLTTVGYGDIVPRKAGQVAYAMVVMALGAAMYGYVIGNVASLLANIDVLRSRHLGKMETINHFMRDRQVPRDLQAKVRDYYNYLWESRITNQAEMLEDLPTPLRVEIALHLNRGVLRKVPLFEGAGETLLRELVLNFEPMVAIPDEAIIRRGAPGRRIFFISKGRVEVLAPDEQQVVATLSEGNFFGEMALLASRPRANTVRALDYCNLYTLDRDRFERVLESFPDFAANVRHIAEVRTAEASGSDA